MQRRVNLISGRHWRTKMMVGGVLLLAAGLFGLSRAGTDTSRWPSVEGTIVESQVRLSSSRDRDTRTRTRDYCLRVRYEYVVADKRYEGSNRNLTFDAVARSVSEQEMERVRTSEYSVGSRIRVYYDPRKPSRAVLDPSPAKASSRVAFILLVVMGAVFGLAAVFGKELNG
jgi:hypothetical protein